MAARIFILGFALAVLVANLTKAQLIAGYPQTLYRIPTAVVRPGLPQYQQAPILPKIGKPTTFGLPLLPKIAPAGLPKISQWPAPVVPRTLPPRPLTGLSKLMLTTNPLAPRLNQLQVRSTNAEVKNEEEEKAVKSIDPINEVTDEDPKIVLSLSASSNDSTPDNIHQTKIRSPDNNESVEELDYLSKAANPIDELESKFGSMIKQVGKGLKDTAKKIDSTLWPSNAPSTAKEAENEQGFVPFQAWAQSYERNNGQNQGMADSISGIMNEYRKVMNNGYNIPNPQFQVPEHITSGLRNAMDEFKQSISDSKLMENAKTYLEKYYANSNSYNNYNNYDSSNYERNQNASPMSKLWKSMSNGADKIDDTVSNSGQARDEKFENNQQDNPVNNIFDSASKFADNISNVGDSASNKAKSEMSEFYEKNDPQKLWEKASNWAGNMVDSTMRPHNMGNNQFLGALYYPGFNPGYYPNEKTWDSAVDMTGKITNMAMNPRYYGGNPMFNPYFQPYGPNYYAANPNYNPPGAVINSATSFAQSFANRPNNGGGYYKRSNPTETSSITDTQHTTPCSALTRTYRQMPFYGSFQIGRPQPQSVAERAMDLAHSILGGRRDQVARSRFNLGAEIVNSGSSHTSQPYKRSDPFSNIWNSATDLAGSITNVAMNPGQIGSGQVLKSTGNIWSTANNLAGSIGNAAMRPDGIGSSPLFGSTTGIPVLNTATNLASNIVKTATSPLSTAGSPVPNTTTNLASSIAKTADMTRIPGSMSLSDIVSNTNTPVQNILSSANNGLADNIAQSAWSLGNNQMLGSPAAIANSATNLASRITNTALTPANMAAGQLFGPTSPSSAVMNRAFDMAGNIVNTAVNPWSYNGPMLQSYGPTYGGGYFPRSSSITPVWNSADQLAGSIYNTAKNPMMIGSSYNMGHYSGVIPLGTVSNSALNLAGNIANVAMNPRSWGANFFK